MERFIRRSTERRFHRAARTTGHFRPFYLYVFSPDPQALNSLVSSLKERLRGLVRKSEPIRELNLSLPYTTGPAELEATIDKEARAFITREHGGSRRN